MRFSLALLCIAATAMVASANLQDIKVDLKPLLQSFGSSQDVSVLLSFTNIGKDLMGLLNVFDPLKELMDPIFNVFCNGERVNYVGAVAKRRAPLLEDFIQLAAGSSITLPIKISDVFNMTQACNYVVQLQMHAHEFFANLAIKQKGQEVPMPELPTVLTSAPISFQAEAHRNPIIEKSIKIAQGRYLPPTYAGCTAARQTQIQSGITESEKLAANAVSYFSAGVAGSRWTTWYGTYSSTNWNTLQTKWNTIKSALAQKTLSFDCGCAAGSPSTYAYVYPNSPYVIYLCGQHWASPLTGTDSQGGTIIHELAHFTVVAATGDHAYGQTAAKNLAISSPTKAMANSDSYQYFCENNPKLS